MVNLEASTFMSAFCVLEIIKFHTEQMFSDFLFCKFNKRNNMFLNQNACYELSKHYTR